MLKVDYDLELLTIEELIEAKQTLHHDVEEVTAHDPRHRHPELRQLFAAIEHAVEDESSARQALAEKHEIAEALGIDEQTGEWLAGA